MIVRLERLVPFPRDAVYAWWTDFRPDDHPGRPSPATSSREILRREGSEIWLRDRAIRPGPTTVAEHVILDPPNGYVVEARYPGADVRYEYRFERAGETTRIRVDAVIRPRHVGHLLLPLFRGWAQRYAERDTDYHLQQMASDLRERGN
jgi:hypothetical protein